MRLCKAKKGLKGEKRTSNANVNSNMKGKKGTQGKQKMAHNLAFFVVQDTKMTFTGREFPIHTSHTHTHIPPHPRHTSYTHTSPHTP